MNNNKKSIWNFFAGFVDNLAEFVFLLVIIGLFCFIIPNWGTVVEFIKEETKKENMMADKHVIEGVVSNCVTVDKDFVVYFEDGRKFTFSNVSPVPVLKGKYYVFTYNGYNAIVGVTDKQ
jgi:hypothetical protein